jgi:hypothetical protein
MNGALMKASSRFAIAAALGLGLGAGSARAADLGGNCCADLEERIAELEATTARKGNRKMSLTITGQVNRSVLWWDDTHMSRAYYGLDNTNTSTRWGLLGSAKVNPSVTIGFEFLQDIGSGTGGTTFLANQLDEDGKRSTALQMGNSVSMNAPNGASDNLLLTRRAAVWIEHKDIGRLTVGRFESAGVVSTIDLAGILMVASSSVSLVNGNFFVRGPNGEFYSMTWGTAGLGDPAANQGRAELVRYTSPTWMGFVFDSSIAERGDYWGAMLRYAGEFSGFRIAAGIGYERIRDDATGVTLDPAAPAFVGPQPNIEAWGGALSIMHVPSGLFVQGHYMTADYSINAANAGYWGAQNAHKDLEYWLIQAGIAKNWFGIGNTAIYGEYARVNNAAANDFPGRNFAGSSAFATPFTGTATQNFTTVNGVTDTELNVWGLGITQNVDAAASTLYLGYRNFSADVTCTGATTAAGQCAGAAGGPAKKLNTDDLHVVLGGMVVRF